MPYARSVFSFIETRLFTRLVQEYFSDEEYSRLQLELVKYQDFPKQFLRHGNFGQLERGIPAMADNSGSDLHQLFPQRGQRPVLYLLWQGQCPHEVGKIVGQAVKLEPDGVVAELAARQWFGISHIFRCAMSAFG